MWTWHPECTALHAFQGCPSMAIRAQPTRTYVATREEYKKSSGHFESLFLLRWTETTATNERSLLKIIWRDRISSRIRGLPYVMSSKGRGVSKYASRSADKYVHRHVWLMKWEGVKNSNILYTSFMQAPLSCDVRGEGSRGGPNFIANWVRPCEKSVRGLPGHFRR